jgi:23S rRNA (cytidine1920-2'-O)/16S rRNA (cytidine1409-2'-O)-methyltransferase
MKIRIDKLLTDRGLAPSRERAQALILAGKVLVNGQKIEKPGVNVDAESEVRLLGEDMRYVSRGGLKLEHALNHWELDPTSTVCMDVGTSTGGFTDCLLQHGAAQVIAVDTGYGQIDSRLRNDARVLLLERTNARYLSVEQLEKAATESKATTNSGVALLVMDVSFISATLVLPAVVEALRAFNAQRGGDGFYAVLLVKPQFEVGRELVGKGGIVRDEAAQQGAVERVRNAVMALKGEAFEVIDSPIHGAEGNREFLLYARF